MEVDQFLGFMMSLPNSIVNEIEKELFGQMDNVLKSSWSIGVVSRVKKFGLTGMAIMDVCEKTESSQKRAVALQAIRETLKPIMEVIETIQVYYLSAYQMAQIWKAVPTWEEFSEYVLGLLEEKLAQTFDAAIIALIEKLVCGTKFQLKANYGFKAMLNKESVFTLVMVSLKTQWDLIDQAS